jgi:anti-sigma regulatory factor (Ser/Thr protein kinase)
MLVDQPRSASVGLMAPRASCEMHLLPGEGDAARIRRTVSSFLDACGVTKWVIQDAVLVADELYANAVLHGNLPAGDRVTVGISLQGAGLEVTVTDPDPDPPTLRTPSADDESGRGIQLVQALSVRWGSERLLAGKRVWALLRAVPRSADDSRLVPP